MANSLEFKISADDQASRVVETVQHKITNFGKDIAKMALGIAGPAALVSLVFSKISDSIDEANKKTLEARDIGAAGAYEELKLREQITKKAIEAYEVILAQKKIEDEKKAKQETSDLGNREAAKVVLKEQFKNLPNADIIASGLSRVQKFREQALGTEKETTKELNDQVEAREQQRINLGLSKERWAALLQTIKEYDNSLTNSERSRRIELSYIERIKKAQLDLLDLENKRKEVASKSITVSSLREMGGGIYGESQAIANQNLSAPAQTDQLTTQLKESATDYVTAARTMKESADKLSITYTDFGKLITAMPSVTGSTFTIPSPLNND
jgi:Cft2 family RNA processing exonuclease